MDYEIQKEKGHASVPPFTNHDRPAVSPQQREQLIHSACHNLRQPLTAILGYAQILERNLQKPEAIEQSLHCSRAIINASNRLASMIQDLCDVAGAENNSLALDFQPLDLQHFLNHLLLYNEEGIESYRVRVSTHEDLPPVLADPQPLGRIIKNLLSSVILISKPCSDVEIHLKRQDRYAIMEIMESATATGLSESASDYDGESRSQNQYLKSICESSLGLSLRAAQRLVEAHSGSMLIEQTSPQGIKLAFTLPFA